MKQALSYQGLVTRPIGARFESSSPGRSEVDKTCCCSTYFYQKRDSQNSDKLPLGSRREPRGTPLTGGSSLPTSTTLLTSRTTTVHTLKLGRDVSPVPQSTASDRKGDRVRPAVRPPATAGRQTARNGPRAPIADRTRSIGQQRGLAPRPGSDRAGPRPLPQAGAPDVRCCRGGVAVLSAVAAQFSAIHERPYTPENPTESGSTPVRFSRWSQ